MRVAIYARSFGRTRAIGVLAILLFASSCFCSTDVRADTTACRPGTPSVRLSTKEVSWAISPCGGGIESIKLHSAQFKMDEPTSSETTPKSALAKFAAGPLELVGSWRDKWDPFRESIVSKDYKDITVGIRPEKAADPVQQTFADLTALAAAEPRFGVMHSDKRSVTLVWPDPDRVRSPVYIVRRYSLSPPKNDQPADHSLVLQTEIWNLGTAPLSFSLQHSVTAYHDPSASTGGLLAMFAGPPNLQYGGFHIHDETVHLDANELVDPDTGPEERSRAGKPDWLATDSRYFALASMPTQGWGKHSSVHLEGIGNGVIKAVLQSQGEALAAAGEGACVPDWYASRWGGDSCKDDFGKLSLAQPVSAAIAGPFIEAARRRGQANAADTEAAIARVQGRRVRAFGGEIFTGPKQLELLRQASGTLDEVVDFGWFGAIAKPLIWVLKLAHGLTGNWPLAIIILTVLVKGVLWPVTGKSLKSMRKMQTLKPELDRIKEKLAEEARRAGEDRPDPNKLNQETFALYKRHGVNPLGGCLPMFVQMPVYIALYRSIYSSVELFNQPLFMWIDDLTSKDPYYALPLLLGVAMFVQTRLTPQTGGDETQRKMMMYFMPVMFTAMMASLPSGLTLYILVNTVLSSVQTLWLQRQES